MKSLAELRQIDTHTRSLEFTEWAKSLLRMKSYSTVDDYLRSPAGRKTPERVAEILKSPVPASTLESHGSLGDAGLVGAGFISSLVGRGVYDTMLTAMRRVPWQAAGVRIASAATAYAVGEGAAKPISGLSIDPGTLNRRKASSIIVVSDSLANDMSAAAGALIAAELRQAVIQRTDSVFLAALADGVSVLPSAGATVANVHADLEDLAEALTLSADSRLFLIVPPATAARLALKDSPAFSRLTVNGGELAGITVIPSDNLSVTGSPPAPISLMVDATQVAASDRGVVLDEARHASLEMATDPSGSSATGSPLSPAAASLVSLWQTNSSAVRAERAFGFLRLRTTAVSAMVAGW